jgi:methylated-DNA-[protein]-cysteine S-methyltransferase
MNYTIVQTLIGKLKVVADDGYITKIYFENEVSEFMETNNTELQVLNAAATQISEYFESRRKFFDLPLKLEGGVFQKRVWEIMLNNLPFGSTISYSELAELAGNKKAARAAGMANNRNPIPIIIPCHRVLGKNGALTGFRAGTEIKRKLLELEQTTNFRRI